MVCINMYIMKPIIYHCSINIASLCAAYNSWLTQILTLLCDDPLPDTNTRIDGWIEVTEVIVVTLLYGDG